MSQNFLSAIADKRNRIPKKSLNYQTPYQVFLSYMKNLTEFDNLEKEKHFDPIRSKCEVLMLKLPVSDTVSELLFQQALHSHSWTRARALFGSLLESLLRLHFHRND